MPNPETSTQKPPEVQEFERAGERLLNDFGFDLYGVPASLGTTITQSSLESAIGNVSKAATEDPSVLALVGAVNESSRLTAEQSGQTFVKVADRPEMGLLKLFGAETKLPDFPKPRLESEISKPVPEDSKRNIGHAILVDGHMVRGMIGGRPNEVVTPGGILRTQGTPRLG